MKAAVKAAELLAAAKIASSDQARPVLAAVYVENNGEDYAITATDSYKLIHFENTHGFTEQENQGAALIAADFVKSNIKASDEHVFIETDGEQIKFTIYKKKLVHRADMLTKQVEGSYPNYKQLFREADQDAPNSQVFNPVYMSNLCDAIAKAYGKHTAAKITFTGIDKAAMIEANDDEKGFCKCIIMPVKQ